jgi:mRNA interferase RelE/StbE
MTWSIEYSKDADNFLKKHRHIDDVLIGEIKKLIHKLNGETVNIKFKKLTGDWEGYYRIRKGKIRIIVFLDFSKHGVHVENIDFRGSVYK